LSTQQQRRREELGAKQVKEEMDLRGAGRTRRASFPGTRRGKLAVMQSQFARLSSQGMYVKASAVKQDMDTLVNAANAENERTMKRELKELRERHAKEGEGLEAEAA
jgi:hypothetical protein